MKHAYLIITHHEFEILKRLVSALDDVRNDIYVHFDKKVAHLPELCSKYAKLVVLTDRIDVRWGDVSQIACEFALFQEAKKHGPYAYYHLLSGVDMPLRSQDAIHRFFAQHAGKEFIGFSEGKNSSDMIRKVQRYHLFSRYFRSTEGFPSLMRKGLRFAFLRLQFALGIRRHRLTVLKKGSNWVSVTQQFVVYLMKKKDQVMRNYQHTFCADEIFLQTLCWNSPFRHQVFDLFDDARGCMRMIGWKGNQLTEWEEGDFEALMKSDMLFARKFSSRHINVVDKVLLEIQTGTT